MVTVKPAENGDSVERLFELHHLSKREGMMAMVAYEGENAIGSGLFSLVNGELTLLYVDYPKGDLFLCDLISRGVMHYGVNRGVQFCELGECAPKSEFVALKFIENTSATTVDIIHTFTMCTHCKENAKSNK